MTEGSSETKYNTNLASEFLMMSLLHRAGKEAYLSLGNKKGVDIVVKTRNSAICTVEVKGNNKQNDWLIGSKGIFPANERLFYALFYFKGKIGELQESADFWLIPSQLLNTRPPVKIAKNKDQTVYLQFTHIREHFSEHKNTFKWMDMYLAAN